jgi:hypothetical protein
MESASLFSLKLWNPLPRFQINHGIRFLVLIENMEFASSFSLKPRKPLPWLRPLNYFPEFLSEFEAIFETALALESGP